MHGFKMRNIGPRPTHRLSYTFSFEGSSRFLKFSRSRTLTVTHIREKYLSARQGHEFVAHAALMMICVFDNPLSDSTLSSPIFVYYGPVDCRPRLACLFRQKWLS